MTEESVSIQAPVIASHNIYLLEQTQAIRSRVVPWDGYQKAALITEAELNRINSFEKNRKSDPETIKDNLDLFLGLLTKLVRNDTIQNILVLLDDMINECVNILHVLGVSKGDVMFGFNPFIKLLKKDDEFIQLKSGKILTLLISESSTPPEFERLSDFISWMASNIASNANPNVVDICVQYLQSIIAVTSYRFSFYHNSQIMSSITDQLRKSSSAQMQYQLLYCFWQLTFVKEIANDIQRKYDIFPYLVEIAKSAIKEKVIRMVVSIWKNILLSVSKDNVYPFVGHKIILIVENLSSRKWSDTEISDDLKILKDELAKIMTSLSTFDEYSSEVRSAKLEWSPSHLSEQFWKLNAARLGETDHELIRILSRLISTSTDPIILAVAAHDIGQYVKYCPTGKKLVQDIGAKTQIMELMTHENADVRYQSLLAVQ